MKPRSTLYFKTTLSLVAAALAAVWYLVLFRFVGPDAPGPQPGPEYVRYLFRGYGVLLSAAFLFGLWQIFHLLTCLERHRAFSRSLAGTLGRLKFAAIFVGVVIVAGAAGLSVLETERGGRAAGNVAPPLLVAIVAGAVATVAAAFQGHVKQVAGANASPAADK